MKPLTKKWLEHATYDLKTAEAMLKTGRYLYVAFMCQQAIEKLIKGIIQEKTQTTPPYNHRLVALLEVAGIPADAQQLDFLDLLTRYYINSRYPDHKQKLSKTLNQKTSKLLLEKTREYFQWLKSDLKM